MHVDTITLGMHEPDQPLIATCLFLFFLFAPCLLDLFIPELMSPPGMYLIN